MIKEHNAFCDCFDCSDMYIKNLQNKMLKPYLVDQSGRLVQDDHADITTRPASYYLDSVLVAKKPVKLYSLPSETSSVVKEFPKGTNVGRIQSFIVRDGQVWWLIDWFSGKHAGYVKHDPALFDAGIAEQTSSGKQQQSIVDNSTKILNEKSSIEKIADSGERLINGAADTLGSLGDNLKWIVLAVILIVISVVLLKVFKS